MALSDQQKIVTFHEDTGHSGILPSGEGNYYDPSQVIRNDNINFPNPDAIIKGSPSSLQNSPNDGVLSSLTPNGLTFNNHGPSGVVSNGEVAQGAALGAGNTPISNATNYPPQSMSQGPYIHYNNDGNTSLLPDGDGAVRYYPTSNISATQGAYYPYGTSPTKYINTRQSSTVPAYPSWGES